jgi:hypothetical protein
VQQTTPEETAREPRGAVRCAFQPRRTSQRPCREGCDGHGDYLAKIETSASVVRDVMTKNIGLGRRCLWSQDPAHRRKTRNK